MSNLRSILLLLSQKYGATRRLYHGGSVPGLKDLQPFTRAGETVPLLWVTPEQAWAERWAFEKDTKNPILYTGRFLHELNIFNGRCKTDWISLLAYCGLYAKYENIIKNGDWLDLNKKLISGMDRDFLLQVIKELGYDGIHNFEVDAFSGIGLFEGANFTVDMEYHWDWKNKVWTSSYASHLQMLKPDEGARVHIELWDGIV